MDSMRAFAMGEANRGKPLMIFDWNRAARRIRETGVKHASAGLAGDWEYTGGSILKDGKLVKEYTYLSSTWATPELSLDGAIEPCYIMAKDNTDQWNSATNWPESAINILNKGDTQ